jgi:peptidoglycan hydrolase-like protein with peptidoglycan-binding domain
MTIYVLTTPPMRGLGIEDMQKRLIAQKYLQGKADGVYGPLTAQAVYRAKYWLGYPNPDKTANDLFLRYLSGDKKPGPIMRALTLKRKRDKPVSPLRLRMFNEARKYIGVKEFPPGSNMVLFSKWYGLAGPWCAMFVSYCADKCGSKFHYAYVPYVVADAHKGVNSLAITNDPQQGDLVCYDWNKDGVADHIGFFDKWVTAPSTFKTIEGNTGIGNDSNGGEVMSRTRDAKDVQLFVRVNK